MISTKIERTQKKFFDPAELELILLLIIINVWSNFTKMLMEYHGNKTYIQ